MYCPYLLKLFNIEFVQKFGLLGKWLVWPRADIFIIQLILPILENRVEIYHAQSCQQSYGRNKACNTPCGEGPTRESEEKDFVPNFVVIRKEAESLADVFRDASTSDCTQP